MIICQKNEIYTCSTSVTEWWTSWRLQTLFQKHAIARPCRQKSTLFSISSHSVSHRQTSWPYTWPCPTRTTSYAAATMMGTFCARPGFMRSACLGTWEFWTRTSSCEWARRWSTTWGIAPILDSDHHRLLRVYASASGWLQMTGMSSSMRASF